MNGNLSRRLATPLPTVAVQCAISLFVKREERQVKYLALFVPGNVSLKMLYLPYSIREKDCKSQCSMDLNLYSPRWVH
jgi:hypothetical protein